MGEKEAQAGVVTASKKHERTVEEALPAGPDYWPVPLQERRHVVQPAAHRRAARNHA